MLLYRLTEGRAHSTDERSASTGGDSEGAGVEGADLYCIALRPHQQVALRFHLLFKVIRGAVNVNGCRFVQAPHGKFFRVSQTPWSAPLRLKEESHLTDTKESSAVGGRGAAMGRRNKSLSPVLRSFLSSRPVDEFPSIVAFLQVRSVFGNLPLTQCILPIEECVPPVTCLPHSWRLALRHAESLCEPSRPQTDEKPKEANRADQEEGEDEEDEEDEEEEEDDVDMLDEEEEGRKEREEEADPLPPVVCVEGPAGSGKSTFCRQLVNRLLCRSPKRGGGKKKASNEGQQGFECVAFLDTDLGQPELTPPGMVSLCLLREPLLESPHCNCRNSVSDENVVSFFLGDVSPAPFPDVYLRAVHKLVRLWRVWCRGCEETSGPPPLVINTHGWDADVGRELVEAIRELSGTTLRVCLEAPGGGGGDMRHGGMMAQGRYGMGPTTAPIVRTLVEELESLPDWERAWTQSGRVASPFLIRLPSLSLAGSAAAALALDETRAGGGGGRGSASSAGSSPSLRMDVEEERRVEVWGGEFDLQSWERGRERAALIREPDNRALRWLRITSHLNPLFSASLHLPLVSLEAFFSGMLNRVWALQEEDVRSLEEIREGQESAKGGKANADEATCGHSDGRPALLSLSLRKVRVVFAQHTRPSSEDSEAIAHTLCGRLVALCCDPEHSRLLMDRLRWHEEAGGGVGLEGRGGSKEAWKAADRNGDTKTRSEIWTAPFDSSLRCLCLGFSHSIEKDRDSGGTLRVFVPGRLKRSHALSINTVVIGEMTWTAAPQTLNGPQEWPVDGGDQENSREGGGAKAKKGTKQKKGIAEGSNPIAKLLMTSGMTATVPFSVGQLDEGALQRLSARLVEEMQEDEEDGKDEEKHEEGQTRPPVSLESLYLSAPVGHRVQAARPKNIKR
uniref:Clp1 P-loop domain-containing protein n=1 Tax=Chromera velia CCMP2878 TaxID=1169474 RepID=A0A0G4GF18_9ALVE|eukprot:Cvel_4621.t1-p1 / transcript=Cvel_4621.t1 / gene=Cvel_4621 / organism=Chromera_velia_CCMP2878 / gene_product=Polynucleotide 5'-hydroxyl-kinase NOL9, putative / transcript_product=Polynucleotide 5'-hydroxyl-kinase NOL9, putative / location=Cvel_scaffold203:69481-75691(-) / protein_length=904 / sequence_SO=supercontig / SO=protein_coding / is_pseudo=false